MSGESTVHKIAIAVVGALIVGTLTAAGFVDWMGDGLRSAWEGLTDDDGDVVVGTDAAAGDEPAPPSTLDPSSFSCAGLYVQLGAARVSAVDDPAGHTAELVDLFAFGGVAGFTVIAIDSREVSCSGLGASGEERWYWFVGPYEEAAATTVCQQVRDAMLAGRAQDANRFDWVTDGALPFVRDPREGSRSQC